MARTGTYNLTNQKDTSFRSFITVLSVVLVLLLLIYLGMTFGISSSKNSSASSSELSGQDTRETTTNSNRFITTLTQNGQTALFSISTNKVYSESTKKTVGLTETTQSIDFNTQKSNSGTSFSKVTNYSTASETDELTTTTESMNTQKSNSDTSSSKVTNYSTVSETDDLSSTTESMNTQKSTTTTHSMYRKSNTPKVTPCVDFTCKKVASDSLAMLNHSENLDYCENFYDYACGDSSIIEGVRESYFTKISKPVIDKSKQNGNTRIFHQFYQACNLYNDDFIMSDVLKNLKSIEQLPLTDIFIHMLLTQTMPFFDVGLAVKDSRSFDFEITLSGISPLRTSLSDWSLVEKLKQKCIAESTVDNTFYVSETSEDMQHCILTNINSYIDNFVEEMEKLSNSIDKNLVSSFTNNRVGLKNLPLKLLAPISIDIRKLKREQSNPEYYTLEQLNSRYPIGDVNWVKVFQEITNNVGITGQSRVKVNFPKYFEEIFTEFDGNQNDLPGILNLWYNIQMFSNVGFGTKNTPRSTSCLKLASQLMPEISVYLVNALSFNKKTQNQYEQVDRLFQQLKYTMSSSISHASWDSQDVLQNRLKVIQLTRKQSIEFEEKMLSLSNYENKFDLTNKSYHKQLLILLENYRKTVLSLAGRTFSLDDFTEHLLMYFVDPFETEPKTFPPSRQIVFHPGFLNGMSKKLPEYVTLATKGFRLSQTIAKHFERDDFDPELSLNDKNLYNQLNSGSLDEINLIDRVTYVFDNDEYKTNKANCEGYCLDSDVLFEDNTAFRLVTDAFENLNDSHVTLPYLDDIKTGKHFVTFVAQELCQRRSLADFLTDLCAVEKLPSPIRMRNMVMNSIFFKQLYGCQAPTADNIQFPHVWLNSASTKTN